MFKFFSVLIKSFRIIKSKFFNRISSICLFWFWFLINLYFEEHFKEGKVSKIIEKAFHKKKSTQVK
jgi:hypothetical protein